MNKQTKTGAIARSVAVAAVALAAAGCGLQLQPMEEHMLPQATKADDGVVAVFFDEGYGPGCYTYSYPESSPDSRIAPVESESKIGDVSAEIKLDVNEWSGAAIGFGSALDLTEYYENGVLQFWIKGENGTERGKFKLQDDNAFDGHKAGVSINFSEIGLESDWKLVTVPLKQLGKRGKYWNGKADVIVDFEWDRVKEFVVSGVEPGKNPSFTVWFDEIRFLKYDPTRVRYEWRKEKNIPENAVDAVFAEKLITGATVDYRPESALLIPAEGKGYESRYGLEAVLPAPEAVGEITASQPWKLGPYLENGAIEFWIKGARGGEKIEIVFVDGPGIDDIRSTVVAAVNPENVTAQWRRVSIPLSEFTGKNQLFEWNNVRSVRIRPAQDSAPADVWLDNVIFTVH